MKVTCKKTIRDGDEIKFQEGNSYTVTVTQYGLDAVNEEGKLHCLYLSAYPEDWHRFAECFE